MSKRLWIVGLLSVLAVAGGPDATAEKARDELAHRHHLGITWPRSRALPRFASPRRLDVVDLTSAPRDQQLLLTTLQGVVNRTRPRIYLELGGDEGTLTWLNDLRVPYRVRTDPLELVARYRAELAGTIIYDPGIIDTINVATTLAGLRRAIVASPELAEQLGQPPYGLPVIEDLRGRFASKIDAYTWQYEQLWPETTHRMLVALPPATRTTLPPGIPNYYDTLLEEDEEVRDASNRAVYAVDLTPFLGADAVYLRFDDAFTGDGWGPAVHEITVRADGQIIAQFIPGTDAELPFVYDSDSSQLSEGSGGHRFADGSRYMVYRFAPPAGTSNLTADIDMWNQFKVSATSTDPPTSETLVPFPSFRDYAVANRAMLFWLDPNVADERALFTRILESVAPNTPYLGWFPSDVQGEFSGVQLTSEHLVYVLAADHFHNMTVFSGVAADNRPPQIPLRPPLENKIYVTFTFTEGDNLQYNQHRMRQLWDDPGRGSVPINWSSSPLLLDAAPAILSHYQRTATPNDVLMTGPSGAGYIYPTPWPDSTFDLYAEQSRRYMQRTGMLTLYALNRQDNRDVPLSPSEVASYVEQVRPLGIMLNFDPAAPAETILLPGDLPQSTGPFVSTIPQGQQAIADASADWDGASPLFVSIGILAWSMTPSDIAAIADSLGPDYAIVRGDHYFQLVREAHGLSPQ